MAGRRLLDGSHRILLLLIDVVGCYFIDAEGSPIVCCCYPLMNKRGAKHWAESLIGDLGCGVRQKIGSGLVLIIVGLGCGNKRKNALVRLGI